MLVGERITGFFTSKSPCPSRQEVEFVIVTDQAAYAVELGAVRLFREHWPEAEDHLPLEMANRLVREALDGGDSVGILLEGGYVIFIDLSIDDPGDPFNSPQYLTADFTSTLADYEEWKSVTKPSPMKVTS